MRCSSDLRLRVVQFVRRGGSKAEAARRFGVGEASVYRWLTKETQSSGKTGPCTSHKLDRDKLAADVAQNPDLTQAERASKFGVSRHCIWHNLQRLGISVKKNDTVLAVRHYEKEGVSAPARTIRQKK